MYAILTSGLQMPINQNSNIWYNPQDYGAPSDPTQDSSTAFQNLISATGGNPASVIITKPYLLKTAVGFTSNLQLWFPNGGQLIADVGITPQINSEIIASPYSYILDSSRAGAQFLGAAKVNEVWADWFGASPSLPTDDTISTNDAAIFAAQSNHASLCFNSGTYQFLGTTQQLFGNGALGKTFDYCNWIGRGKRKTIFSYPNLNTGLALLVIQGGSGQVTDMTIEGIFFQGTYDGINGTYAIQFRGIGGVLVRRCKSGANKKFALASNIDGAGSFTEYDILEDCEKTAACGGMLETQRTTGDDSFHGTGVRRMLNNASANESIVLVGANCKLYNSEVSGQVWTNGTVNLIDNRSTLPITAHGDVSYEAPGTSTLNIGGGTGFTTRTGDLIGTGLATAGSAVDARAVIINADSSRLVLGARQANTASLTTGANTLASNLTTAGRDIDIRFSASNYSYRYKLHVDHNGFGAAGYVRSLVGTTDGTASGPFQPVEALNSAGYGAPTFSVDTSGRLVVTNAGWPAVGVTCWYEETQSSNTTGGVKGQV